MVGLIEIENDGNGPTSAIADLVNGLNAAMGPGTYAFINDPATGVGTDAIKNAIIYKPAVVTPQGAALSDTDVIYNRFPIAQAFRLNANGEVFVFVVNHFKSKRSGSGDDGDKGDGQGRSNFTRKQQATALLGFIDELEAIDADVLTVGDYNAYIQEDPIDILLSGGLVNLLDQPDTYSYIFNNQSGSLDHALVTPSLSSQVTGAAKWHINADEPNFADYTSENAVYQNNPYRSSDHDPILVGLRLITPTISFAEAAKTVSEGIGTYTVQLALSEPTNQDATVTFTLANGQGAVYGSDYTTTPGATSGSFQVTIPAGSTTASFAVNVVDDNSDELDETVKFDLVEVSSGLKKGDQLTYTLTIEDNDVPVISFTTALSTITEGTGVYTVTLKLSTAPVTAQTVSLRINDYAANYGFIGGGDYTTVPDGSTGTFTLNIPAGATAASFTVTPDKNAAKKKEGQTIDFTLLSASAGLQIGEPKTFTLTIIDGKSNNKAQEARFAVWPNPTNGLVSLMGEGKDLTSQHVQATLRTSTGEVLYTGTGTLTFLSQQISQKLQKANLGSYLIEMKASGEVTQLRVLKL